ncbi:MAG TPA: 3-dehydroquinate synthase family protein, partial [Acidobacteriota bacterium]|nr:3-dehydroquinate synthase family protein [Acidobacteriota bacterium]
MEFTCKSFQDRTYSIYLDWNLLQQAGAILQKHRVLGSLYIISDTNVFRHHGRNLLKALAGYTTHSFTVPPGEGSKSLTNWRRIQDFLSLHGANRRSAVIAFGGGVIGDLAGFAASTFMRGLDFIQIPTTLLSQSDSSIGAKVAVNHPLAKNLIGSFYQPKLILTDPSILQTLPAREFSAGLGEAIKYGVIEDQELFEKLYERVEDLLTYNKEFLGDLIMRCIGMKIRIVEKDE